MKMKSFSMSGNLDQLTLICGRRCTQRAGVADDLGSKLKAIFWVDVGIVIPIELPY